MPNTNFTLTLSNSAATSSELQTVANDAPTGALSASVGSNAVSGAITATLSGNKILVTIPGQDWLSNTQKTITLKYGANTLGSVTVTVAQPSGGSSSGGTDPAAIIDFYVSAYGSPTGEGTETDPLDTIAHAAEKLNDTNKDWVIGIDGLLSDVQILMDDPSSGPYLAKSITLVGVSGNASNDGIDTGWNGVSTPTGNVGSALTVKTTVPVTLKKITIKGGDAQNGGGLYMYGSPCSVTMVDSYITGNAAVKDGGGVFVEQGTLTMKSGGINGNKTVYVYGLSGSSAGNGGGVLLSQGGSVFDMQGGTVNSNEAASYGGAVYLNCRGTYGSGSFIMSGGSISGNDCGYSYGDALYLPAYNNKSSPAYFEMSGSAVIAGNNDVFLGSDGFYEEVITIAGPLTGQTPVATITGQEGDPELAPGYQNHQVLSATGSGSISSSYTKFAVKDCGSTPYYIDLNGCLTTSQPQILNLYVKQGGNGSGTSANSPFGSIQDAAAYIASNGTPGTVANIKISGDLSGSQQLQGIDNTKASAIIIEGANGVGTNGMPKDALTGGYGVEKTLTINVSASDYSHHVPVTIQNLKINGAAEHGLYVGDGNGTYWNEVYLESGTLITNNGSGTGNYDGAGVYIDDNAAVVVRNGCTISGNEAGRNGGGIYALGFLDLEAGTITGNTAQKGKGIYAAAPGSSGNNGVRLFENASVASNNDIYLCDDEIIYITEPLSSNGTVATITPESYSSSVQVLEVHISPGGQSNVNLADECQKFNVTTASDGSTWEINEYGYLNQTSSGSGGGNSGNVMTFYVSNIDEDDEELGTIAKPFGSISNALDYIADQDCSGKDVVVKISGALNYGPHEVIHTVYISSFNGDSLTIEGANGLSNGTPQDGIVGDMQMYFNNTEITFKNIALENGSGISIGGGDPEVGYYRPSVVFGEGVLIKGKQASWSDDGAVMNISTGSVTIKDGCVISGNYNAATSGENLCDGISINSGMGALIMEGGTIKNNHKPGTITGIGVCVDGNFVISGNAVIESDNLVYLASSSSIVYLGGSISLPSGVTYAATIKPYEYNEGDPIVDVAPNAPASTKLADEVGKLAVLPADDGSTWSIDETGALKKTGNGSGGGGSGSGGDPTSNAFSADGYISNGQFSVSADKKVYFSRGNLQYHAVNNEWRFAEHQYDMIEDNNLIAENYDGWISMFGYGTSGWSGSGKAAYQPWTTMDVGYESVGYKYIIGDLTGTNANADWGVYNSITNGGAASELWRTLSNDEWKYLFQTRSGAANKYGIAKVGDVNGMVILPDDWVLPSGLSFNSGVSNETGSEYATEYYAAKNTYTLAQWVKMEEAGAVFLPAEGYRYTYSNQIHATMYNQRGSYWSSSNYDETWSYILQFIVWDLNFKSSSKDQGFSVRLVKDVE